MIAGTDMCDFIHLFCACTQPGFDTTCNTGPNLGASSHLEATDRVEIQTGSGARAGEKG